MHLVFASAGSRSHETALNELPDINEHFFAKSVPPHLMDALWASGWRHFGEMFFRYSLQFDETSLALQLIQPLRIDLERFSLSKSQRRVLNKNTDLRWEIIPARAGDDVQEMFHLHKQRFTVNVPETLFSFIGQENTATEPCECLEFRALFGDQLIAASFLAIGSTSASSIYGVFDPDFSRRSLGALTMLKEIEHCRAAGHLYYYPGYATRESSAYDYKKRFGAMEFLDWSSGLWESLPSDDRRRETR